MKYLMTFEIHTQTGQHLDYSEGDIVISCVDKAETPPRLIKVRHGATRRLVLKNGDRYKVLRLYNTPEDKFLNNPYMRADVENIETGEISKGWDSRYFKTDVEFTADKFNM